MIRDNSMEYQPLPPEMTLRNKVKRAIQTCKDHFVAILCGIGSSFPMPMWQRLFPQTEETLTNYNKQIYQQCCSAYINSSYVCLAIMDYSVQVHDKPTKIYVALYARDRADRLSEAVFLKPKHHIKPTITSANTTILVVITHKDLVR